MSAHVVPVHPVEPWQVGVLPFRCSCGCVVPEDVARLDADWDRYLRRVTSEALGRNDEAVAS